LQLERKNDAMKQSMDLADLHLNENRLDDADAVFHTMLGIDPENREVYRKLIDLNRSRGKMNITVDLIKTLSGIQQKTGDTLPAIETLKEIFAIDALNVETYRQIIAIQKEIGLTNECVETYIALSDVLNNTGNLEEGMRTLEEAITLKPDDIPLRRKLFNIHLQSGDTTHAIEDLFFICDLLAKEEHYPEVLNILAEILEIDPGNLQTRKRRAETYALMGDEKKALAEFLKLSSDIDSGKISMTGMAVPRLVSAPEITMVELPIMEEYTFENFVVGTHNNFAYATSMAVAKAPAQNYNPLFLCSDVGLGKTHLIHAIANYIKSHRSDMKILYTNSEEFTSQLIDAIQNNTILQFRARHKTIDLLLLDDVQFLAGKERAQEEFFHLFNTLFQAKKQIVITSDRPPKDIAHLEKRLKSRFGAGIIVDIQPPDLLTRVAILKKEHDHIPDVEIGDNIINLIAEKVDTNIRDLKGAFNQIIARHRITNQLITEEMVIHALDSLFEKV
jgi:chromosomal replication initiator protein DnaA